MAKTITHTNLTWIENGDALTGTSVPGTGNGILNQTAAELLTNDTDLLGFINDPTIKLDTGVVKQGDSPAYTEDFVFGSPSLDDDGTAGHDAKLSFDKSKGAFRAGEANSTTWDDANRGNQSTAFGLNTTASGAQSMAEGLTTIASGIAAHAEGSNTTASGAQAHAEGLESISRFVGSHASASGKRAVVGDAQYERVVVRNVTTNATQTILYPNAAIGTPLAIPSGCIFLFEIVVVGAQYAGATGSVGDSWAYKLSGLIRNLGGTTTLVGNLNKEVLQETDVNFDVDVTANDTADSLEVKVTGATNKSVSWVATVHFTEVGFA